jgi:hypothetical protein
MKRCYFNYETNLLHKCGYLLIKCHSCEYVKYPTYEYVSMLAEAYIALINSSGPIIRRPPKSLKYCKSVRGTVQYTCYCIMYIFGNL